MFGKQPCTAALDARDPSWDELPTFSAGHLDFRHHFQVDRGTGIRRFPLDPTKWWIWVPARTGLARDLRRAPASRIAAARRAAAASPAS